jgi:hypothetical protein
VSQQVNLYNPALLPKTDLFSGSIVMLSLVALLGVTLLAFAWSNWRAYTLTQEAQAGDGELAGLRNDLTALSAQVAAHKPTGKLAAELVSMEALLAGRNEVIAVLRSGALGDTKGVSEYFRAFGRQSVDGLWLTGFSIAGAGADVVIEGRTLRAELVPSYIRKLRHEEVLRGRSFEALAVQKAPQRLVETAPDAPPRKGAEFLEFRMSSRATDSAAAPGGAR